MGDVAIRVETLSKLYRIGARQERHRTLRDTLTDTISAPIHFIRSRLQHSKVQRSNQSYIWALKDLSFEVKRGEVIGIIGRNGAGKTTLLKILSRITEPTKGYAEIGGRAGSLLEVGTGFHPELTGRENIYLNGAILGMKKAEIERKFDDIVAFAEVERFIDTPVKRYSSGMYVRLAFAVAAHLEPEILLVDEVLAVGDYKFQQKCLGRMGDMAGTGRTVLLVSHNLGSIARICKRALLLEAGQLAFDGDTNTTINNYLSRGADAEISLAHKSNTALQIMCVRIMNSDQVPSSELLATDPSGIQIEYEVRERLTDVHLGIWLYGGDGNICLTSFDTDTDPSLLTSREPGRYLATAHIPARLLNPGFYSASVCAYVHWGPHYDRVEGLSVRVSDPNCMSAYTDGGHRMGYFYPTISWENKKTGVALHEGHGWIGMSQARY